MARILILGGTRNLGHVSALALLHAGHDVTVLNRGITPDELPGEVERLHAAREDHERIQGLIKNRMWDVVVDTTSYTRPDASSVCELFRDRVGKVLFISTGQVYLVRTHVRAPFKESDYDGPIMGEPTSPGGDHDNWLYGVNKREAEEVFRDEASRGLPVVSLRLPMIASDRDHYARIQGYIARIQDGGPIVVPSDPPLPIRHVYVEDAAKVIALLSVAPRLGFSSLNISYGESISLGRFLEILAREVGRNPEVIEIERERLVARDLLPACSPYSGKWMSELENTESLRAFPGLTYTPPASYVSSIVADYERRWKNSHLAIPGYTRRSEELALAKKHG